jgi:hypothetical protein
MGLLENGNDFIGQRHPEKPKLQRFIDCGIPCLQRDLRRQVHRVTKAWCAIVRGFQVGPRTSPISSKKVSPSCAEVTQERAVLVTHERTCMMPNVPPTALLPRITQEGIADEDIAVVLDLGRFVTPNVFGEPSSGAQFFRDRPCRTEFSDQRPSK